MQLYDSNGTFASECEAFQEIISQCPQFEFFQPSPDKAPWHVQVIVDSHAGREGEMNFLPYKLKASYCRPSVQGIHDTIGEALSDVAESDDFDVFEDLA